MLTSGQPTFCLVVGRNRRDLSPPALSLQPHQTKAEECTYGGRLRASSAPMSPQTSSYTRRVPSRTRPPPHVGGDANAHRQVRHDSPSRAYAYSYSPQPARCSNKRRTFVQDPDEAMQERIKRLRIASRCGPSHMARLACWRANAFACGPAVTLSTHPRPRSALHPARHPRTYHTPASRGRGPTLLGEGSRRCGRQQARDSRRTCTLATLGRRPPSIRLYITLSERVPAAGAPLPAFSCWPTIGSL